MIKEATTLWLCQTGTSKEIERDRVLKDLSEDLSHASTVTTETIYLQAEN